MGQRVTFGLKRTKIQSSYKNIYACMQSGRVEMISLWQTGEKDKTFEIYFQIPNELSSVSTSPSTLWQQNPTDRSLSWLTF